MSLLAPGPAAPPAQASPVAGGLLILTCNQAMNSAGIGHIGNARGFGFVVVFHGHDGSPSRYAFQTDDQYRQYSVAKATTAGCGNQAIAAPVDFRKLPPDLAITHHIRKLRIVSKLVAHFAGNNGRANIQFIGQSLDRLGIRTEVRITLPPYRGWNQNFGRT